MDSILNSIKQLLGIPADYDVFDVNVLMFINTAIATLTQLGVGPTEGFSVVDDTATWDSFLGDDDRLNMVQTYVYARVRLLFDPPTSSFLVEALEKQAVELEWRLNVQREGESWVDPTETATP